LPCRTDVELFGLLANIEKIQRLATPTVRRMIPIAAALVLQRYREDRKCARRAAKRDIVPVRIAGTSTPSGPITTKFVIFMSCS
jgi:hypothetical protein